MKKAEVYPRHVPLYAVLRPPLIICDQHHQDQTSREGSWLFRVAYIPIIGEELNRAQDDLMHEEYCNLKALHIPSVPIY